MASRTCNAVHTPDNAKSINPRLSMKENSFQMDPPDRSTFSFAFAYRLCAQPPTITAPTMGVIQAAGAPMLTSIHSTKCSIGFHSCIKHCNYSVRSGRTVSSFEIHLTLMVNLYDSRNLSSKLPNGRFCSVHNSISCLESLAKLFAFSAIKFALCQKLCHSLVSFSVINAR